MKKKTPQLERGFIQIATGKEDNDVLMALIKHKLSGTEWSCIMLVIRKTWGFKKKEDWISLSQMAHYTNRTRRAIVKATRSLENKNVLVRKRHIGKTSSYQFNKVFTTWKLPREQKYLGNKSTTTREQKGHQLGNKSSHTKETITKETITKEKNLTKKLNYLKNIPDNDIEYFFSLIFASRDEIKKKADDLFDYCQAKGKKYKNYKAFLRKILKKDFGLRGGVNKYE